MPCALVLSAGALFGAYQAGAWSVLSQNFQPDLVVGTSIGSLNGWAIAGGCSAADLLATWRDPATAPLTLLRPSVLPWRSWVDPAPLERHVRDWFARFSPRVPFSATMVQVPRLRQVRIPGDRITPQHLLAACSAPIAYPPVRIDGHFYVDGGVLDLLPLWAAVEMGATSAIAVNVLPQLPSRLLRTAVGFVRLAAPKQPRAPDLAVVSICPRAPLGTVSDSLNWNEHNIERWIRQGEEDARACLPC